MRNVLPLLSLFPGGLVIIPSHSIITSPFQSKIPSLNQEVITRIKLNDDGIIIASDLSAKDVSSVIDISGTIILAAFIPSVILILTLRKTSLAKTLTKARGG